MSERLQEQKNGSWGNVVSVTPVQQKKKKYSVYYGFRYITIYHNSNNSVIIFYIKLHEYNQCQKFRLGRKRFSRAIRGIGEDQVL